MNPWQVQAVADAMANAVTAEVDDRIAWHEVRFVLVWHGARVRRSLLFCGILTIGVQIVPGCFVGRWAHAWQAGMVLCHGRRKTYRRVPPRQLTV